MKTIISLFALVLMCSTAFGQLKAVNYVVTESDSLFCQKIEVRAIKTKCWLSDGSVLKVKNSQVNMYADNGKIMKRFESNPNNLTKNYSGMMELIDYKNGISIYKYEKYNGVMDCTDAIFCYYNNNNCIYTQRNPTLAQIENFVNIEYRNLGSMLFLVNIDKLKQMQ